MVSLEEWTRSVRTVNKAKMTFRFDGQGREVEPMQPNVRDNKQSEFPDNVKQLFPSQTPTTYHAVETMNQWGDPFTDHTGTEMTVYHQREQNDKLQSDEIYEEDPLTREDWYDNYQSAEDEEEIKEYNSEIYAENYHYRPTRTSWWKLGGSITGAIVTGALFGFVVLSLFNNDVSLPFPSIGVPSQNTTGEGVSIPVLGEIGLDKTEEPLPINLALPEQTYYFLQYGVFSTAQGVQLAQEELQASGIAAARDTVDEKRVYAGVSPDREQAKLLSGGLKAEGVNLILHEISLPKAVELQYSGDVQSLERYLSQSVDLVNLLSSSSASLLGELTPKIQSVEDIQEQGEKHQLWTESAAAIRGKLSPGSEQEINEMEKAMNSAVEAMGEYNKKQAKTLLWEVQNQIMRFILAEQKLVTAGQ
ncbi:SPOR domain-containing protein [Paenibacillus anaericanus]|uniref:SPOR domain-containing protein n=1 Tax=Paenibacillus anaericanus TaxID=170367 RepID=A0A3S1C277_9BACL|nr:SPOR domain-containing protein [Paenibacillus anaericanus]